MQNPETHLKLTNLLLDISEGERQTEVLRQILCEEKNFEPYAAFQRIDRSRKNSLTVSDILAYLTENNISHTEEYCSVFIRHYDIDSDSRLDYSEFLRVVLPANNPALRAVVTQRETYKVAEDQNLEYEVECALAKVIDKEISFYLQIDAQKLDLTQSPDYKALEAFTLVDIDGSGRITFTNLKKFFEKEDVYPTDEEISAVLRRIDRDRDGIAPIEDFIEALHPLDFSSTTLVDRLKATTILSHSPNRDSYRGVSSAIKSNTLTSQDTKPWRTMGTDSSPLREYEQHRKVFASGDRLNKSGNMTMSMLTPEGERRYSPKLGIARGKSPEKTRTPVTRGIADRYYSGTVSPGKYRKEASPYKKSDIVYSERVKVRREFGSGRREEGDRKGEGYGDYGKGNVSSFEERMRSGSYRSSNVYKRERSPIIGKSGRKDSSGVKKSVSFKEESWKAVDLFRSFVYLDKEVEGIKKHLAMQLDFNLFSLFRVFDVHDKGKVDSGDIEKGMRRYGIYPGREELYLFMRRFDRKNMELLTYGEFMEIFRPLQYESLNIANSRILKSSNNTTDLTKLFSEETRGVIAKVLGLHLENEKSAETLRENLRSRVGFNPREAFNSLDKNGDGFLTIETLKLSFEEKDVYLMKKEYELLINRLDHNMQGKISYADFVNEINPKR